MQIVIAARWGVLLLLAAVLAGGCKKETPTKMEEPKSSTSSGEALFKQHCAVCHPDGGNIIKPGYTLNNKSMAGHNITKPEDIVKIMRNPESGMTKFDEKTINDKDATDIARYIMDTFK